MILRALASNEASPNLSQPIATRGGSTHVASLTGLVGFLGYGAGLVLFVYALRQLGSARTGAYFSTAPLLGVIAVWCCYASR